jgi:hypothetical protein
VIRNEVFRDGVCVSASIIDIAASTIVFEEMGVVTSTRPLTAAEVDLIVAERATVATASAVSVVASSSDLATLMLNAGTSAAGWTGILVTTPSAPAVNNAYSPPAVEVAEFFYNYSKLWVTIPATPVGSYSHVEMDVRVAGVAGTYLSEWLQAVVSDGPAGTGTRSVRTDMKRQIPNTVGATLYTEWHTISIPLTGLDVVRSVGIENRGLGLAGTGRAAIAVRNVRFAAASGIDQAIHRAGTAGHVVVPSGYTSALTQHSWVDKPAGVTVEDRRPGKQHTTGAGGMVWADDFFLDHTGTVDVAADLAWVINNLVPRGQTLQLHPGGHYRLVEVTDSNSFLPLTATGITIRGNDSTLFAGRDDMTRSMLAVTMTDSTISDVSVVGEFSATWTGDLLAPVTGTPTVAGTTIELDAAGEMVRLDSVGADTPWLFGRDRFGKCKLVVNAKDTGAIAGDLLVEVVDPVLATVVASKAFKLTSSFADYVFEWTPNDLTASFRFYLSKATATPNTITIASVVGHRPHGYWSERAFNAAWNLGGAHNVRLENCRGESIGGDALQISTYASDVTVDGFHSRNAGRQGVSFNWGERIKLHNFTVTGSGRSGIDIEPYTTGWFVRDIEIRDWRLNWVRNWPLLCENWGSVRDVLIANVYIYENGRTPFAIGANGMIIDNVIASAPFRHPEGRDVGGFTGNECGVIYGRNVTVGAIETGSGWVTWLTPPNSYDETKATVQGNDIAVLPRQKAVTIAYAVTIAPHHTRLHASDIFVGTLTGNITIANPPAENQYYATAGMWRGFSVTFHFTQDATGGHTVTWGNKYRGAPAIDTAANARTSVRFVYDGIDYRAA